MVVGTAKSMGITVSGDALLIKDMAKLTKAKREAASKLIKQNVFFERCCGINKSCCICKI
jgi:hypothetical protein